MANFGALTDHWGLTAALKPLVDIAEVVASSKIPQSNSRADAEDESGDIADAAWHGNDDGLQFDTSVTYAIKSGTLDLSDLALGQLDTGKVITSIEVSTSNGAWPQVTVAGVLGCGALEQDKAYDLPAVNVLGQKKAQLIGVAVTTGRLTDCSLSASCDFAQQEDGEGEPVAWGVSGAIASASATAVAVTAEAPELAAAAGWAEVQDTGVDEPQAAWHTASITVEDVLDVTITE